VLFVPLFLFAVVVQAQTATLPGHVVRVVDGDTIHVRLGNHIQKVRYIGMNAPELHHPTKGVRLFGRILRRIGSSSGIRPLASSATLDASATLTRCTGGAPP
jgi:endonuclease YncB( thermonuclease family)